MTQNPIESVRQVIKRLFHLTDDEIDKMGVYLGGVISPYPDVETWAEREYKKDTEGWQKLKDL